MAKQLPYVWVEQQDAHGCALATLAMICGHTYEQVKATVDSWSERGHDWAKDGTTHYTLDRYLASEGLYIQRRYATWQLPLEPFAPVHYAAVQQTSGYQHFVVVLSDGAVLDPYRPGTFGLSDWPKVDQLVGILSMRSPERIVLDGEAGKRAAEILRRRDKVSDYCSDREAEGGGG